MLIQSIVSNYAWALYMEMYQATRMAKSCPQGLAASIDDLVASAQLRFERSIESLMRIRKIARSLPAIQVNIAAGGKQANIQNPPKQ